MILQKPETSLGLFPPIHTSLTCITSFPFVPRSLKDPSPSVKDAPPTRERASSRKSKAPEIFTYTTFLAETPAPTPRPAAPARPKPTPPPPTRPTGERASNRKRSAVEILTYHSFGEPGTAGQPSAAKRPRAPSAKPRGPAKPKRVYYESVELDDESFRVGSSAYVILDPACLDAAGDLDESEPCEVCRRTTEQDARPMLECDM